MSDKKEIIKTILSEAGNRVAGNIASSVESGGGLPTLPNTGGFTPNASTLGGGSSPLSGSGPKVPLMNDGGWGGAGNSGGGGLSNLPATGGFNPNAAGSGLGGMNSPLTSQGWNADSAGISMPSLPGISSPLSGSGPKVPLMNDGGWGGAGNSGGGGLSNLPATGGFNPNAAGSGLGGLNSPMTSQGWTSESAGIPMPSLPGGGSLAPLPANTVWFTFKITGGPEFAVYAFTGNEKISSTFGFSIELINEYHNVDIGDLLGRSALLTIMDRSAGKRLVHGVIRQFEQLHTANKFTHYKCALVPRFWFLGQNCEHRIFQNKSVVDIIEKILKEQGFTGDDYDFKLQKSYPAREYCVQYGESDLYFISRLAEEEGIYYYFEHKESSHCLSFSDAWGGPPIVDGPRDSLGGGTLRFYPGSGNVSDTAVISRLNLRQRVNSDAAAYKEWNFEKPKLDLTQEVDESDPKKAPVPPGINLQVYQYPHLYQYKDEGKRYADIQLLRQLTFARWVDGQGDVARLTPGYTFTLVQHPRRDVNSAWWIVSVRHEGQQPQVLQHEAPSERGMRYGAAFMAIPEDTRYVPPLEHEKNRVIGDQTAIVTGPPGEEIYPDKHGRVKVQFFWDREGKWDDKTTCWIRVSQGWAGGEYGTMAIPRIGHEVVVSFLEGNPDRPIITGRVYHGTNTPPYALPDHKTRTVFKSLSSPGGGGFNEFRIEDKKGEEEIYAHAEKDVNIYVKNDWKEHILHDKHRTIDNFTYLTTKGETHEILEQHRKTELKQNDHLTVKGESHAQIDEKWLVKVGDEVHIKTGMKMVLEAGSELTIKAGGSFVKLDASGAWINGSQVMINSGGSPGSGSGATPDAPDDGKETDKEKAGFVTTAEGASQERPSKLAAAAALDTMPKPGLEEAADPNNPFPCRQSLVAMAEESDDPALQALGKQYSQELVDEQRCLLAEHVYNPDNPVPPGWERATTDPDTLAKYGLTPGLFHMQNSNFGAEMYVPDPKVFGTEMQPTIAFKGTEMSSWEDWVNNGKQGMGFDSLYYQRAEAIGRTVQDSSEQVDFAGHSLGGGLASAAALRARAPATIFNSAGLSEATIRRTNPNLAEALQHAEQNTNSYRLDGDILTYLQEHQDSWIGGTMPSAVGRQIDLPSDFVDNGFEAPEDLALDAESYSGHYLNSRIQMLKNRVGYHGMDRIGPAVVQQRARTQQAIQGAVGKQCP